MVEADGYLLVPKEFIVGRENGTINNMHIFDCTEKSHGQWSASMTCRCGQAKRKKDLWNGCVSDIIERESTLRNRVAEIENDGTRTVCGRCVATLYTDGE